MTMMSSAHPKEAIHMQPSGVDDCRVGGVEDLEVVG